MNQPSRFALSLNGELWLALVLVVFTTIAIRLTELPLWQDAAFFVNGERLMATHDAYTWLAGAKDIGNYASHPFARLLAILHEAFGFSLADLGFWSPLFFVSLLAIPVALLASSLRLPEGALVFGILTTSGLGFLVRTRLGFCDTDLIALLFPLSVACCLADGLARFRGNEAETSFLSLSELLGLVGAGLLGRIAIFSYPSNSTFLFVLLGAAFGLGVLLAPARRREALAVGLLLAFALTFSSWLAVIPVGAWTAWSIRGKDRLRLRDRLLILAALAGVVLFLSNAGNVLGLTAYKLLFYVKTSVPDLNNATGLKLPDIAQSVREAQNLDWSLLGPRMGGNWIVFVLGLAGFGFVCWRRPALLIFLPFLGLGLASMKLGNRFAMYGTVGIGMGLGLGLSELLAMLKQSQGRRWIAQLLMACVVLWPSADLMQRVSPVPVLPQTYAQTFLDLKKLAEPSALLWQWWDYGYAGQYYAERATMGDGARQSGPWLYPLAKAHCATSPREAAQLMRFFGQSMLEAGSANTTDVRAALLKGNPVTAIQQQDAATTKQFLADLAQAPTVATTVPNYFVVSWENLRLGGWIGYYGHWDIVGGASSAGKIQQMHGQINLDSAAGAMAVGDKTVPVDSLDVVEEGGTRHFDWPNGTGMHVLINQFSRQVFLMDSAMYNSMMVQMLIAPPQNFAEEFTLVVDKYPWARAYKVR